MDVTNEILIFALHGASWVLWLLIGLSIASVAVMIERLWFFVTHRLDAALFLEDVRELVAELFLEDMPALPPELNGTAATGRNSDVLSAAVEGAKARERMRLERNLVFLATLGSNAPFIGLFGTVLGIIKAFHDLSAAQQGGPAVVMAGISEALVATAVGLVVAIPAIVAFNYFNRRIRTRMFEVERVAQLLLARFRASGSRLRPADQSGIASFTAKTAEDC